ncbi:hypothetical protein VCSRO58_0014 [Vibrio cholerae]|nr:hypothetical protein VCSRO58_0014 [Vibrio cholerae]
MFMGKPLGFFRYKTLFKLFRDKKASGIPLAFSSSLSIYVTKYAFRRALRLSRDRFGLCRLFQHSVAKTGNRRTDSNRDQVQQHRAYRIRDQEHKQTAVWRHQFRAK